MTVPSPDGQRIQPALPVTAMKSYQIVAPLPTHWRKATCAEVECGAWRHGWQTLVPADSAAAEYIRHDRTRSWTEEREPGGMARFTFPPGQEAFASPDHEHRLPLDRPEIFIERGGDWRGNPRLEVRRHATADDWVDSFANHQQKLADRLAQG